jgi:hypothetical protein
MNSGKYGFRGDRGKFGPTIGQYFPLKLLLQYIIFIIIIIIIIIILCWGYFFRYKEFYFSIDWWFFMYTTEFSFGVPDYRIIRNTPASI